ncbi:TetR family transcriptional regulator [Arthrobacter sp. TE12232]
MARDAEATKRRILDAAEEEFARYGIAGARVDRIADNAQANKAMLYRYFDSKDRLFEEVFTQRVLAFVDEAEFDAADLAGYAGRTFDVYQKYPNILRLTNWYILERGEEGELEELMAAHRHKIALIEQAQVEGLLPADRSAIEILTAVRALAMTWHTLTPEMSRAQLPDAAARRAAVVENVRRLIAQ